MSAFTGVAVVAAMLLAIAGGQKLLDPSMTAGALAAMGLPSSPALVRLGSIAEVGLGIGAIVFGGSVLWWLTVLSYTVFTAFVGAAMSNGSMVGTCGCFGREDTPPHPVHIALNVLLALAAGAFALSGAAPPAQVLADDPASAVAIGLLATLALGLLLAAYVELPRALATGSHEA